MMGRTLAIPIYKALPCFVIIRVDSNATLTAAVIKLGLIKSSDCSHYVSNDNDHLAEVYSSC